MPHLDIQRIAIDSYREYGSVTDFKNYQGLPMPEWEQLPEKIKAAWIKASTHAFIEGMRFSEKCILKKIEEFELNS